MCNKGCRVCQYVSMSVDTEMSSLGEIGMIADKSRMKSYEKQGYRMKPHLHISILFEKAKC